MRSLAARLTVGFAVVILLAAGVTTAVATVLATRQIRHVMVLEPGGGMQMTDAQGIADRIGESYARSGSWDQARAMLEETDPHLQMMGQRVVLVDSSYALVVGEANDVTPFVTGWAFLPGSSVIPIQAASETVGYLQFVGPAGMSSPMVEDVVSQVTRGVWTAAVLAGLGAFTLALLIVRNMSTPLANLSEAAQAVAAGDLSARAPVAGPEEVRSVAAAFNAMAGTLERQEGDRRALLADIAHELRTPLAVMQAQMEALVDGVFPPTPQNLAPLHAQTQQLTRLVSDLRTLADADAGALKLDRAAVLARDAVAAVVEATLPLAKAKGIALESAVRDETLSLDADSVRLHQVLVNLVTNALQHTPEGRSVRIAVRQDGRRAVIEVADPGSGIPPESLPHIFDRFYRGEGSRSRSTGGSGLGLAIARQLTESHGGTIAAESRVGTGTTIRLTWPVSDI